MLCGKVGSTMENSVISKLTQDAATDKRKDYTLYEQ